MLIINQFFYHTLFGKGIITLEDIVSDNNELIIKQKPFSSTFILLQIFLLMQIIDALPMQWRNSLTSCGRESGKAFVLENYIKSSLKNHIPEPSVIVLGLLFGFES